MAKKVVATLKRKDGKGITKVIKMVKSKKTGAYIFKQKMVSSDKAKQTLKDIE